MKTEHLDRLFGSLRSNAASCALLIAAVSVVTIFPGTSSARDVDVVETATREYRGLVKRADMESVTIEITVHGRQQEITIPRDRVTRLTVHPPPSIVAGIEAYEQENWSRARLNLDRVVQNYKGLDADWAARGMIYFGRACMFQGDHESAQRAFTAFLNAYPENDLVMDARLGLAEVERAKGNHAIAIEMFRDIAEPYDEQLRPPRGDLAHAAEAYMGMGKSLQAQGNLRQALEAFVRITALYPAERFYPEALYRSAVLSAEMNRFEIAKRYLSELVADYPATEFARRGMELQRSLRTMGGAGQ